MAAKDHFWVHLQPESEGYLVGKIQLPTDDRIGLECLAEVIREFSAKSGVGCNDVLTDIKAVLDLG